MEQDQPEKFVVDDGKNGGQDGARGIAMKQGGGMHELVVALGGSGDEVSGELLLLCGKRAIGKAQVIRGETRLGTGDLEGDEIVGCGGIKFLPAQ